MARPARRPISSPRSRSRSTSRTSPSAPPPPSRATRSDSRSSRRRPRRRPGSERTPGTPACAVRRLRPLVCRALGARPAHHHGRAGLRCHLPDLSLRLGAAARLPAAGRRGDRGRSGPARACVALARCCRLAPCRAREPPEASRAGTDPFAPRPGRYAGGGRVPGARQLDRVGEGHHRAEYAGDEGGGGRPLSQGGSPADALGRAQPLRGARLRPRVRPAARHSVRRDQPAWGRAGRQGPAHAVGDPRGDGIRAGGAGQGRGGCARRSRGAPAQRRRGERVEARRRARIDRRSVRRRHGNDGRRGTHDDAARSNPGPRPRETLMGRWAILNGVLVVIALLLGLEIARTWGRSLPPVEIGARGADPPMKGDGSGDGKAGEGKGGNARRGGKRANEKPPAVQPATLVATIVDKDLFDPSRQKATEEVKAPPPKEAPPPPNLTVVGIRILGDRDSEAFITDASQANQQRRLRIGDEVGGYTVKSIQPSRVTLASATGDKITLNLVVDKSGATGTPGKPGAPPRP